MEFAIITNWKKVKGQDCGHVLNIDLIFVIIITLQLKQNMQKPMKKDLEMMLQLFYIKKE